MLEHLERMVLLAGERRQHECKTMLDALNRVTACYRHLVITLGSTSDSQNLREELRKTRKKAQELAAANRTKLTALLKDKSISKEDRSEYERLWVLFTSSMELLDVDMKRSLEIGQDFPLQVPTRHLIQTGMSGSTTTVAARAMSVQNMKYEADSNIDTADLKELEAEIAQVVQMMEEMEMKVQVAPWAVEAKQEAGAELKSTVSVVRLQGDNPKHTSCCCCFGSFSGGWEWWCACRDSSVLGRGCDRG
uniref:Regulator of G protein signaling 9 binding protein n=1 Tax=Scleropages formosus TaxID=113540 RepID=A0A8C9VS92_SCLFO